MSAGQDEQEALVCSVRTDCATEQTHYSERVRQKARIDSQCCRAAHLVGIFRRRSRISPIDLLYCLCCRS